MKCRSMTYAEMSNKLLEIKHERKKYDDNLALLKKRKGLGGSRKKSKQKKSKKRRNRTYHFRY